MTVQRVTGPVDLRRARRELGLTATDVGTVVGVHPTTVLRWERRDRLPGPGHLRGLARAYGLPVAAVSAFFDEVRAPAGPMTGAPGPGLRRLRRMHGLTAVRLAETLGVPTHAVYNWEAGRARIPQDVVDASAHVFALHPLALARLLQRWGEWRPALAEPATPLRRLRRRAGFSQAELARSAGVGVTSLKAWERGATPTLAGVRGVAHALDLPTAVVARAVGFDLPEQLDPSLWAPGDLAGVLRVLRQWSRVTQHRLAHLLGCSTSTVRAWEQGRLVPGPRSRAALEHLHRLADGALLAAYPRPAQPTSIV